MRHWQEAADAQDSSDPAQVTAPEPVDELHLSRTLDGRYRLDGSFAAETGEIVHSALEAQVDRQLRAARDGDPSVPLLASHVRASALVDLAAQSMRHEPSDQSAPDRYRVAVVVPSDTEVLPSACCDSPAFRVVLGAASEVLDVGRLTQHCRRASAGQSRCATGAAFSRDAAGLRHGRASIIVDLGPTAG